MSDWSRWLRISRSSTQRTQRPRSAARHGFHGAALRCEPLESRRLLSGAELVADINRTAENPAPTNLVEVGLFAYFVANDGVNGYELWRSDGTTSGTFLVEDIRPGGGSTYPRNLTDVGGVLYFSAFDDVNVSGLELWRSDGTNSGTYMVEDIRPGPGNSVPRYLTNVGGVLYFNANDGVNGYELWRSDGTTSGTYLVEDIRAGSYDSYPQHLTNVGGVLYFATTDVVNTAELWRSDGTTSGTFLVEDIRPGSGYSTPGNLTNISGTLYFRPNDGIHGDELWRSDGTTSGTFLVKDVRPGSNGSSPRSLTNVGGMLYFSANDGLHGDELWRTIPETVPPVLGSAPVTISTSAAPHGSYVIPTGSGEQLRTVPLAAINRVQLKFTEDMRIDSDDIVLRGDSHGPVSFFSFAFDLQTKVATWHLDTVLPADRWAMTLNADGDDPVTDEAGNPLDGEWDNPTDLFDPSSSTLSGDGVPGGDFVFRFTVLSGDANRDNLVTGADYTIWADHFDNAQGPADKLFSDGDWNGDGHVTGADYTQWSDNVGLDFTAAAVAADGNFILRVPRGPQSTRPATHVDRERDAINAILAPLDVAARLTAERLTLSNHQDVASLAEPDHRSSTLPLRVRAARHQAFEQYTDPRQELLLELVRSWREASF